MRARADPFPRSLWATHPMHPSAPDPLRFQEAPSRALATTGDSPVDLWRDWDILADSVAAPPFLRPDWIAAWHRAYGNGELRLLSVQDGRDLTGIVPIEVRSGAML